MPWGDDPANDASDAIRSLVGDTDASNPLLSDNTYLLIISQEASLYARAAAACEAIAGKFGQAKTKRVGDLWYEAKVVYEHYVDLAQKFRLDAARRCRPYAFAGGVSKNDIDNREDDDDRPAPAFRVGMLDSDLLGGESLTSEED